MKISNQHQKINFTSQPLHYVKVINDCAPKGYSKMIFSSLAKESKNDVEAINEIQKVWPNKNFIKDLICNNFISYRSVGENFAIEKPGKLNLGKRIVGLMNVQKIKSADELSLKLSFLLTKDNYEPKKIRKMSGIGEVMFAEAVNMAKKVNADKLEFFSFCDDFYTHSLEKAKIDTKNCKFPQKLGSDFVICNSDFNKILKYCKDKYQINF